MLSAHREFLEQVNPAQPILIVVLPNKSFKTVTISVSGNISYMTRKSNNSGDEIGDGNRENTRKKEECGSDQLTANDDA